MFHVTQQRPAINILRFITQHIYIIHQQPGSRLLKSTDNAAKVESDQSEPQQVQMLTVSRKYMDIGHRCTSKTQTCHMCGLYGEEDHLKIVSYPTYLPWHIWGRGSLENYLIPHLFSRYMKTLETA